MRLLLLVLLAVPFAAPTWGQAPPDDDAIPLAIRTERAAWAMTLRAALAFERVAAPDSAAGGEADLLAGVRHRAYQAGLEAARAHLLFQVAGAFRHERGDAVPRCADERAAAEHLDWLAAASGDLVALDAAGEALDVERMRVGLEGALGPLRPLIERHLTEPVDVCPAEDAP